jgi:uncharacterized protein VirK/YbjX
MLERVLWAICQQRQSRQSRQLMRKRRITFDYIEFWLSMTVHPNTCTPREEMIQAAAGLAKEDTMTV